MVFTLSMGTVEDITPAHPSWGFSLKKWLGIPYGKGTVIYYEGFLRPTRSWRYSLVVERSHKNRKQFQTTMTLGLPPTKSQYQRVKGYQFLYRAAVGDGRRGGASKDIIMRDSPLGDGICLLCGKVDPFVFENDHPLGWRHDEDFVITVCADCHRLKTYRYFWLVEKRIEKWLSDSNYS